MSKPQGKHLGVDVEDWGQLWQIKEASCRGCLEAGGGLDQLDVIKAQGCWCTYSIDSGHDWIG